MFYIWWPAYIVPGLMVLAGFAGQLLRQFGLVFAALSFMIMRSVRLVASSSQQILLYIAVILQIIGAVALILPVERNLKAYFDDQEDET